MVSTSLIILLSNMICVRSANCLCRRSMVISRLSGPPRSNRLGFCPEVAIVALYASSSSFPPSCLGVLGAWGVSPWVSWLFERLLLCDAIRNDFANVYNRFFIDDTSCGVVVCRMRGEKIEDRHPQQFYGCIGSFNPSFVQPTMP